MVPGVWVRCEGRGMKCYVLYNLRVGDGESEGECMEGMSVYTCESMCESEGEGCE